MGHCVATAFIGLPSGRCKLIGQTVCLRRAIERTSGCRQSEVFGLWLLGFVAAEWRTWKTDGNSVMCGIRGWKHLCRLHKKIQAFGTGAKQSVLRDHPSRSHQSNEAFMYSWAVRQSVRGI